LHLDSNQKFDFPFSQKMTITFAFFLSHFSFDPGGLGWVQLSGGSFSVKVLNFPRK